MEKYVKWTFAIVIIMALVIGGYVAYSVKEVKSANDLLLDLENEQYLQQYERFNLGKNLGQTEGVELAHKTITDELNKDGVEVFIWDGLEVRKAEEK